MQLTAARAYLAPPSASAPIAEASRAKAPAMDMRPLPRDSEARERASLLEWIERREAGVSRTPREGGALALAISAALHAVLLFASGALLFPPKIAPVESPAGNVVFVNLEPKASQRAAVALPPVTPSEPRERSPAPTPRPAPPESLARMPAPSAPPAIAVESAAPSVAAASDAVPAIDGSRGVASQPDRAVAPPAPASSGVSTPAYLYAPEPEYPQSAREEGQEGLVVLRILVSSAGRPAEIRIARSSGFRALDAAAIAGVKRWTFVAAIQGERNIDAWMDVPIRFHLK